MKLYPRHDLNIAATQQNIGVHLTATNGVSVVVNTTLGTEFNAGSSPPWQKHDVVAGAFVPRATNEYASAYLWENAKSDAELATVRVTNPNASPVTVKWTIYPRDGGAAGANSFVNRYEFNQIIAPFGTVEMPINSQVRSETVSDPFFHAMKLESSLPVVPLVSFEQNVEVPQAFISPLNSHFWGLKDPSRAHQIFLINPNATAITIQSEAWDYGSSGTTLQHEIGDPITVQPFDAVAINATSSDPVIGPEFDSHFNKVLHFFTVDTDGAWSANCVPIRCLAAGT